MPYKRGLAAFFAALLGLADRVIGWRTSPLATETEKEPVRQCIKNTLAGPGKRS
jgi:hypothetical protein